MNGGSRSEQLNVNHAREEQERDLGFGSVLSAQTHSRLLNRDGTFNVRRKSSLLGSLGSYHALLTMPWSGFFGLIIAAYIVVNLLFAAGYLLCGPGALQSTADLGFTSPFLRAFFFSVHTFATIGYGNTVPVGIAANVLVTVEALASLLGFALATGLLFARFSRPVANIVFSRFAVVAPFRNGTAFQFRISNAGDNQISDLTARIVFSRLESNPGGAIRKYHQLTLDREKVVFFPLVWTIVHPIDESSPLYGATPADLIAGGAEFLVLLTGIEETFSQTVHTRSSYRADEIAWNAKFVIPYTGSEGNLSVDMDRFHQFEKIQSTQSSSLG